MRKETIPDIKNFQLPTPSVYNIDNIKNRINELESISFDSRSTSETNLLNYYQQLFKVPLNPTDRNLEQQNSLIKKCSLGSNEYVEELYNTCFIKTDEFDPENNKYSQIKKISSLLSYILDKNEVFENILELVSPIANTKPYRQTILSNFREYWAPDEELKRKAILRMKEKWDLVD
jgi:hypothetical protein